MVRNQSPAQLAEASYFLDEIDKQNSPGGNQKKKKRSEGNDETLKNYNQAARNKKLRHIDRTIDVESFSDDTGHNSNKH